jgi:pimeloyl-ACP methyl ester carboxylesterase
MRLGGPVVLAGHAYAGGVIAATAAENVRALVYVAALAPAEGEPVAEIFGRGTPHPQAPAFAPDAHGLIWLPDEAFAGAFAHRATAVEQTRLRAVQRPISIISITTPVGRPRWQDLPTWYLIAEEDRMIPSDDQRFMAERMGATVRSHPVDHMLLLTAPEVVTEVLLEAVRKVEKDLAQG